MLLHAAAALAAAPGDLHVPEILFAPVGPCHVFAFFWRILDWPSRALGAVVSWTCDIGVALEWSVPGACKKQSSTFSKEKGYDSLLQASTQALTRVDPGDFVTIKGWDGHSIDGSPSLGKGQATGRVDVPVGAMKFATSFDYVDAALLHRSPQCVVLVNPGSHVEKNQKTVFVKAVERKTRVRRAVDSTQIWELLDDAIDIWAAVNGKRVDMHDTMAKIGIRDQDTFRCYGRLKGGAQRFRQPPQDTPGQWTCSLCGQERAWPTKARCFRCGNHDPRAHVPVIGPTGRPPQRTPATNPTFRPNGRQNKISGQHKPPAASTQQFPTLTQQSHAEDVGDNHAVPFVPGMRVDLLRDLLKHLLTE